MKEYYVLTTSPVYTHVLDFIKHHALACSIHLNRTRFSVPPGPVYTEFHLRFGDSCPLVDPQLDLATGLPKRTYC